VESILFINKLATKRKYGRSQSSDFFWPENSSKMVFFKTKNTSGMALGSNFFFILLAAQFPRNKKVHPQLHVPL
jgi:hypothetical protein